MYDSSNLCRGNDLVCIKYLGGFRAHACDTYVKLLACFYTFDALSGRKGPARRLTLAIHFKGFSFLACGLNKRKSIDSLIHPK